MQSLCCLISKIKLDVKLLTQVNKKNEDIVNQLWSAGTQNIVFDAGIVSRWGGSQENVKLEKYS